MTELKHNIPKSLYEKIKRHPEIKWDTVAQSALERYVEKIEITEKITSNSKFTIDDVEEFSNEITKRSWQQHKDYLKKLKK